MSPAGSRRNVFLAIALIAAALIPAIIYLNHQAAKC